MNNPPPDTPEAWLARARSDLALARLAMGAPGVLPEDACFHAQQCCEKALKALLVHLGVAFPRTHVLELLMDLLESQGVTLPNEVEDAIRLTQYAVETRYPGAWEPVDAGEAGDAVDQAAEVLSWIEDQLVAG